MKNIFVLLVLLCLLNACKKDFSKNYKGMSAQDLASRPSAMTCDYPELRPLPNKLKALVAHDLFGEGYIVIGEALFKGTIHEGLEEVLKLAQKIGACTVLLGREYSGSKKDIIALAQPTTQHS